MQHEAAIKVAMPDKANAIDYKLSLSLGQLSAFVLTLLLVEEFARFKKIK